MAPARCLGRRWKISNDEYGFARRPLLVSNVLLLTGLLLRYDGPSKETVLPWCVWISFLQIPGDLGLCWWSRRGYINDVEGRRNGLNMALGIRLVVLAVLLVLLMYWLFFTSLTCDQPPCLDLRADKADLMEWAKSVVVRVLSVGKHSAQAFLHMLSTTVVFHKLNSNIVKNPVHCT